LARSQCDTTLVLIVATRNAKGKIDFTTTTTTKKAHPNIWVFSTLISPRLVPLKDSFVFQLGFFSSVYHSKYQPPYSICWKCAVLNSKTQSDQQKSFPRSCKMLSCLQLFTCKKFTKVGYCVSFFNLFASSGLILCLWTQCQFFDKTFQPTIEFYVSLFGISAKKAYDLGTLYILSLSLSPQFACGKKTCNK
jgi:hypothetical protein